MYSLLIIDDERIVRAGIRTIIKEQGTSFTAIYECGDGVEALNLLKTVRPDLIITDIKMPKMDGLLFIERCMSLFPEHPPRIIVLSGYKDFEYARKAMHFGVKDYLLKPLRRKDLLSTIAAYEKALSEGHREEKPSAPALDPDSVRRLYQELEPSQIHFAAIRFPIGTRRAEPEEMSRFTEATDAYFGSDPLILSFPEQTSQLVLAGKLSGKMEEFRAFLRSRQIDGCAIGYSDAQQSPDTCAEGIAKAKQALKIACLNPAGNFFLYKQGGNYSENGKLLAAMQYIHDHFDEDIGMAQVANSVSLNYNYFSSMFKSQLGVNFMTFLTQLRIEKAKALLKNDDCRIGEIARLVGYSDPKRFSKAFLRWNIGRRGDAPCPRGAFSLRFAAAPCVVGGRAVKIPF